jgi:Tol biopolymer transport system component
MTDNDGFDRTVSGWLHDQAGRGAPAYLDEVLARTMRTRQRPAWSSLERWLPMDLTTHARAIALPGPGKALLIAAGLLALVGLAILAVGSRQPRVPAPFGPAENGLIGYWAEGDILVAESDGSHARVVVGGPTEDIAPLYSRDGTRMAFLRLSGAHESRLMIGAPDGSAVREVLQAPLTDADWLEWSPDDESLAVVHNLNQMRVLSIVDIDGGTIRTLDLGGLAVDNSVYWRPTAGSELIFTARTGSGSLTRAVVYSIQADGSRLTPIAPAMTGPAEYLSLDPSPDGLALTYWRWEAAKGSRIHRLDITTGTDREATFDPTATGETGLHHSPDGATVVVQREDSMAQLMVAPTDASRPGILIGPRFALDSEPTYGFSPDGDSIYLDFPAATPQFLDVATGAIRPGPGTASECCSWQRLAP